MSRLWRVLKQPCGPKAGMEHGGRGFRAGQTGLSAARAVLMCSWDSTQYWIVRLVHLWRFQLCCLLHLRVMVLKDECAIDLGFRVVGTMVTSTESVQTPFTIELWGHCGSSEHSLIFRITTFDDSCWVFSTLVCRLGTGISHGYAHIVLSLGRLCGIREWRGQHRGILK